VSLIGLKMQVGKKGKEGKEGKEIVLHPLPCPPL
jgi:hypothetical protein